MVIQQACQTETTEMYFHHVFYVIILCLRSDCALFFCSAIMATDWRISARAACFDESTPNIHITVVDGNAHKVAFSFADFLKIRFKFAIHLDGNAATVIKSLATPGHQGATLKQITKVKSLIMVC